MAFLSPFAAGFDQVDNPIYLLGLALLVSFLVLAYRRLFSPLAYIPGPFWARITPLWRVYRVWLGDWHQDIRDLHQKYGNLVRIAPNEISLNTPTAIDLIYGHSGKPWIKDAWYETWWVRATHPFFAETDPGKHRNLRRRVSKAFSMSYVITMERHVDYLIKIFLEKMASQNGNEVDLAIWTQFLAFDVVGELAFGKNFGYLDAGKDHNGLLYWVYMVLSTTATLGWTWSKSQALKFRVVQRILNEGFLKRLGYRLETFPLTEVEMRVREKMQLRTSTDRADLLSHFLQMKNPDGSPVHPMEVFGEAMNVVMAGADTTAISIRAVVRFVAMNTRVYSKLRLELDSMTKAAKLSTIVTFEEAQALPYLQAVIKESLRLFPAVGYQLPRIVPPGGATIEETYIPADTVVGVNAWSLHRNPEIYGTDADDFRPERWLESDPETLKMMDRCYASFGFGSRTCIGKNLAYMEMSKLLPTLFRDYDVEVCDGRNPWVLTCAWFVYQSKFFVRVRHREKGTGSGNF